MDAAARYSLLAGPVLYVLSWAVEFAAGAPGSEGALDLLEAKGRSGEPAVSFDADVEFPGPGEAGCNGKHSRKVAGKHCPFSLNRGAGCHPAPLSI